MGGNSEETQGLGRKAAGGGSMARDPCAYLGLRWRSISAANCLAIRSATSALAPRNLAPLLSWVLDHSTSPSLPTSRTVAKASCLRSWMLVDSFSPSPRLNPLVAELETLLLFGPARVASFDRDESLLEPRTFVLSEWENVSV